MKTKTIFFTPSDVKLPENRSKGIKTPGWNIIQEWTDSNGNARRRVEPIIVNSVVPESSVELKVAEEIKQETIVIGSLAPESSVELKVAEEIKQETTETVIKTKAKSK
jgi:hypothetical protein